VDYANWRQRIGLGIYARATGEGDRKAAEAVAKRS